MDRIIPIVALVCIAGCPSDSAFSIPDGLSEGIYLGQVSIEATITVDGETTTNQDVVDFTLSVGPSGLPEQDGIPVQVGERNVLETGANTWTAIVTNVEASGNRIVIRYDVRLDFDGVLLTGVCYS